MTNGLVLGLLLLLAGGQYKPSGPVFPHSGGGGAPTVVQTVFFADSTTNTTVNFGTATTGGNTLVGLCQTTQFGGCTVTDSAGNTYVDNCATVDTRIWSCISYSIGAASATSMTFTFIFNGFQVGIYEVAGATAIDVDPATAQSTMAFGSYTSQTVPFTTTHNNELLLCNGLQYGTSLALTGETWTIGTTGMGSTNQGGMMATATQATAGAGACTMNFTDVGQRSAQIVLGLR